MSVATLFNGGVVALLLVFPMLRQGGTRAAETLDPAAYVPFDGERTAWHDGYARYDFVMDEQTVAITSGM